MSPQEPELSVEEIGDLFSNEIRSGGAPSIADYLEKHPKGETEKEELRKLLSSIEMIEGLKRDNLLDEKKSGPADSSIRTNAITDYTIVREIGRGGMGVVYEAIHQSLGRRVAIKVLSDSLLDDPKHLARFRIEARAAAKLRHSNIVPVFGVGSTEHHHYYVMDYIQGTSLRERIHWLADPKSEGNRTSTVPVHGEKTQIGAAEAEDLERTALLKTPQETSELVTAAASDRSGATCEITDSNLSFEHDSAATNPSLGRVAKLSPHGEPQLTKAATSSEHFRWVATVGATVGDAIGYAHNQGVLHRDIKPANLLVDEKDEVWVADFGLAKLSEQQDVTKTGDVIGTPQYMPPETFDGSYDERSEIYAIGLTLYELITLNPAIQGRNVGDTIRQATTGVAIQPSKRNPAVPKDLETIVMKALSHDPDKRYGTAHAFSEDLKRFLSNRPILARKLTIAERLVRWAKRDPIVAGLTAATFLLLTALASVSAWGYLSTKSALGDAEEAQQAALASEQKTAQALASVQDLLSQKESEFQRAELNLQSALKTFEKLMANIGERGMAIDANFILAEDETAEASVNEKDAELLEILVRYLDELADNNSEDLYQQTATAAHTAGDIYVSLGNLQAAETAYSVAEQRYEKLRKSEPNNVDYITHHVQVLCSEMALFSVKGRYPRTIAVFGEIQDSVESTRDYMQNQDLRFYLAQANRLVATLAPTSGIEGRKVAPGRNQGPMRNRAKGVRQQTEANALKKAIDLLEDLVEESPDSLRFRTELVRSYRARGEQQWRWKGEDTYSDNDKALALLDALRREFPRNETIKYEYAVTLLSTAVSDTDFESNMRKAENVFRELQANSDVPRYRAIKALGLQRRAEAFAETGKRMLAREYYFMAAKAYTDILRENPELKNYRLRRAKVYEALAELMAEQGDFKGAKRQLELGLDRSRNRRNIPSASERALQGRFRQKIMEYDRKIRP